MQHHSAKVVWSLIRADPLIEKKTWRGALLVVGLASVVWMGKEHSINPAPPPTNPAAGFRHPHGSFAPSHRAFRLATSPGPSKPDVMCLISANPIGESVNTHQLSGLEVYSF